MIPQFLMRNAQKERGIHTGGERHSGASYVAQGCAKALKFYIRLYVCI